VPRRTWLDSKIDVFLEDLAETIAGICAETGPPAEAGWEWGPTGPRSRPVTGVTPVPVTISCRAAHEVSYVVRCRSCRAAAVRAP